MSVEKAQPFNFLRITAHPGCTFGCEYCNPEREFNPEMMSTQEVIETVRAGVELGIDIVHLTGGEPTMRSDIVELVTGIKQEGVNTIEMTTNGVPFYKLVDKLASAGLTGVNISLDTLDPEKFQNITDANALHLVHEAIKKAHDLFEGKVVINMVVMKKNQNEINRFVEFSIQQGVMVRFCELTPHGPYMGVNPSFFNENHVSKTEILETLHAWRHLKM